MIKLMVKTTPFSVINHHLHPLPPKTLLFNEIDKLIELRNNFLKYPNQNSVYKLKFSHIQNNTEGCNNGGQEREIEFGRKICRREADILPHSPLTATHTLAFDFGTTMAKD